MKPIFKTPRDPDFLRLPTAKQEDDIKREQEVSYYGEDYVEKIGSCIEYLDVNAGAWKSLGGIKKQTVTKEEQEWFCESDLLRQNPPTDDDIKRLRERIKTLKPLRQNGR